MKKIALFDFDKTLIKIDSVVGLRDFLVKSNTLINLTDVSCFNFNLTSETLNIINKQNWINTLKGMNKIYVDEILLQFVESDLLNETIDEVFNFLIMLKKQDYEIVIISASYRKIIEHYFQLKKVNNVKVICTELEFIDDIFTGNFWGLNCSGINKLIKLKNEINLSEYDLENSYAFTDHISDVSFLTLVGKRYVVHLSNTKDDWSKFFNVNYIKVLNE